MAKNVAVFGLYPDRIAVTRAVESLKAEGFRNSDVSVLFSTPDGNIELAHKNTTKSPEGTATGLVAGGAMGGVLGWLVGIGTLAIPGVGPFIAAGPIMAALAGVGVGSALGGMTGALIGLGIPEYEAKRYENRLREGGVLLSVHCDDSDWSDRAEEILKRTGAEDISRKDEVSDPKAKRTDATGTTTHY